MRMLMLIAVTLTVACLVVYGDGIPSAPTNFQAEVTVKTQARLTWVDTSDNETGFRLEYSRDGYLWSLLGTTPPNDEDCVVKFYADGLWWFRICAFNAAGDSPWANTCWVGFKQRAKSPPLPPFSLYASVPDGMTVELTWLHVQPGDVTAYEVWRSGFGLPFFRPMGETSERVWQDHLAGPGIVYLYSVRAVNAYGHSEWSNLAWALIE